MNLTDNKRRRLLVAATGLLSIAPGFAAMRALVPTPRQSAGPFYPVEIPLDDDNDLTRVAGRIGQASGKLTDLSGRILDTNGQLLKGVRVEIWQCDANGRYRHPQERGDSPIDAHFQGHGHTTTDTQGRYRFRTIRPVPYPGRTPHIHAAVFLPGQHPFTTQIYVKDEPRNTADFLFNLIPDDKRHLVVADFAPSDSGDSEAKLTASFDLIIGATPAQG